MSTMILGNCDSPLALKQAQAVLSELSDEWPDINLAQRTIQARERHSGQHSGSEELLAAVASGRLNIAVMSLDKAPLDLPEGLRLGAVMKRLEPRQALVSRGSKTLDQLAAGAKTGVSSARDAAFLKAAQPRLESLTLESVEEAFSQLAAGDLEAIVWPSAKLIWLERRHRIDQTLDPAVFPPAVAQGALGFIVPEDDDFAAELVYSLQHRPSYDRILAERSFARGLAALNNYAIGALATVTREGELTLFGAVTDLSGDLVLQAEVAGEAREAEELGRELAHDVLEQLKTHS